MKRILIASIIATSLVAAGTISAQADESATARAALITKIGAQWNPIFDSQYARIMALTDKAKTAPSTSKEYKALLLDFNEVRRVINDGLSSSSSDLDAVAAYAEEETGEFMSSISHLEKSVSEIKSLTCVKGKLVKKVTEVAPKCPSGYKKK